MAVPFRKCPWGWCVLLFTALVSTACGRTEFVGGDEAPIRVKGGSIHLELLGGTQTWQKLGSDEKHWKTGGRRDHADYILTFDASPGTCNVTAGRKTTVRVTYSDNHWIEFTAQGNHTRVESDVDLSTTPDKKTLSYVVGSGYISAISTDGNLVCAFGSAGEFKKLDAND
jgi:hypothetical protein